MLLLIIPRNENNTQKVVWCKYYEDFFFPLVNQDVHWIEDICAYFYIIYIIILLYYSHKWRKKKKRLLLQVSSSIPDDFYCITLLMLLRKHCIYIHFYILLWRLLRNLTWNPFSIIQILNLIGIYQKWLACVSRNPWAIISNILSTVCLLSFVKYMAL